jgi:hypothetical protein
MLSCTGPGAFRSRQTIITSFRGAKAVTPGGRSVKSLRKSGGTLIPASFSASRRPATTLFNSRCIIALISTLIPEGEHRMPTPATLIALLARARLAQRQQ